MSALLRGCLSCGTPTADTRCRRCEKPVERARHNRAYDSPAWRRFRTRVLAAWRREHGDWCPEDGGHPSADLTVDHPDPLSAGGPLLPKEPKVMCRSHNSRKGSRVLA